MNEVELRVSTHNMPPSPKMLSGEVAPVICLMSTLMVPVLGLSSMIQPMASSRLGTKKGTMISTSNSPRNGVSVRVTIHANAAARPPANAVLTPITATVVRNSR
mgnify:CR=1 FL=1